MIRAEFGDPATLRAAIAALYGAPAPGTGRAAAPHAPQQAQAKAARAAAASWLERFRLETAADVASVCVVGFL